MKRVYPFFLVVLVARIIDLTTTYMFLNAFNWNISVEGNPIFRHFIESLSFPVAAMINLTLSLSLVFLVVPFLIIVLGNKDDKLDFRKLLPFITWLFASISLGAGISNLLISQGIIWNATAQYTLPFIIAVIVTYNIVSKIDKNKTILFPILFTLGKTKPSVH